MRKIIGTARRGQLLYNFGPGAILDFRTPEGASISVLNGSLDRWDEFLQNTKVLQKRLEHLDLIKEDVLISRAFAEPKKIQNLAIKKMSGDQKILLMVSEQQAIREDKNDWKYIPSAASKILGKKTGFLEFNPPKK